MPTFRYRFVGDVPEDFLDAAIGHVEPGELRTSDHQITHPRLVLDAAQHKPALVAEVTKEAQ